MNNSIFIIALIVAIVFFLFKFLEMRFITKKKQTFKIFNPRFYFSIF